MFTQQPQIHLLSDVKSLEDLPIFKRDVELHCKGRWLRQACPRIENGGLHFSFQS
jgi:hypothetical protein